MVPSYPSASPSPHQDLPEMQEPEALLLILLASMSCKHVLCTYPSLIMEIHPCAHVYRGSMDFTSMLRCFIVIQMRRVRTGLCRHEWDCGMDRETGNIFFWPWILPNPLELSRMFKNILSTKNIGKI